MIANLDKIHEMHKLLSNKNRVNDDLLSLFGRFGLGQAFRRLGMERQQGVSALQRIISLFLFWFNGESIFSIYRKDFHSHLQTGKNYFAIYQIRWSIEVFLKESKGYLGFGKYQALDLSGQIADSTICYMTYMVMVLDIRLNDYDTFRKLSKGQRLDLMELTLWLKVLDIIRRIMNALAELIGISAEELVDNIIKDEKSLKKYYVMIESLEQLDKAA